MIWAFIGGFRGVLVAGATALLLSGAFYAYNDLIDNPSVVREARKGFVLQFERDALLAQVAEEKRQRIAAETARLNLLAGLKVLQENQRVREERLEADIAEYEKKLQEQGRSCFLDDDDMKWILK